MESVRVFAPASVANVACGFDIFAFALQNLGDIISIERSHTPGLQLFSVNNPHIPLIPGENTATVSAAAMLEHLNLSGGEGFMFSVEKGVGPGSGLGSSASSAVAAVYGLNQMLGEPLTSMELLRFAGKGEQEASGKMHFDNVAASLLGGFILVRSDDPLDIVQLEYPDDLYIVIAHPQIQVKTADAKKILGEDLPLKDAITQMGNVAGLTTALVRGDYDLMQRSLVDVIAEPSRAVLIPGYSEAKAAALDAGAVGCNLAGSGPSIFCICRGPKSANRVIANVKVAYSPFNFDVHYYISRINSEGAKIL